MLFGILMPSLNAVSSSSKIQFWYSFFAGFQFLTAQFIRKIFSWIKKEKKTPKNVTYAHDIAAKTRLFLFCNVCNNFFPFRKKKGNVKKWKATNVRNVCAMRKIWSCDKDNSFDIALFQSSFFYSSNEISFLLLLSNCMCVCVETIFYHTVWLDLFFLNIMVDMCLYNTLFCTLLMVSPNRRRCSK